MPSLAPAPLRRPRPTNRRNITAKKLAKAIKFVLDNPAMKSDAESLGVKIRKENGVAKAVREIENYIEATHRKIVF